MPPIKLEVISHDVQTKRVNDSETGQGHDSDSHTMRAKLISVLPEQVRSYGSALHCIMMLLYIPFIVDALYLARMHGEVYTVSYGNDIFHKRHSNPGLPSVFRVGFIIVISLGFAIDVLRSIWHVFCDVMKHVDEIYDIPYECSIVGTQFANARPIIDFAKLEVTFTGGFSYNFDHDDWISREYSEDPNNARKFEPGEQFEIEMSPVQYMCLFKQANKLDDDPV